MYLRKKNYVRKMRTRIDSLWNIQGFIFKPRKKYLHLLILLKIILIFALAKLGEISLVRESAFFALFLSSESGPFAQERG